MAGALANTGTTERAETMLAALRGDSYGGAVGLACYALVRGDVAMAVDCIRAAAPQRFPAFIAVLVRPFEPLLRQSPAWPDALKAMNLRPARA
jgi:hypothetical protein